MSFFKRANWQSGLTYKQTCPLCKTEVIYKDDKLGFRPWFPDGFVYCPTCQKPLRHNENYSINDVNSNTIIVEAEPFATEVDTKKFCSQCGAKLRDDDKFCSQCGTKI